MAGADGMGGVQDAIGQSEVFLDFQERLSRVAGVDRPVLIIGERGTGKELAAKRIHYLSTRWEEPLVELNCAALAATLIESELFGHEAGAFTGAQARRRGRFEAAHSGTLFLDELGNIPLQVQEKILRVVEYGSFERVGGAEVVYVDARIIGATNADLRTLADEGRFMRDLLDRLSFEVIYVPPLRERGEDILLLADHFAARMAVELGKQDVPEFSRTVEKALLTHPWRGNVRELKNVIERAVYRAEGDAIKEIDFDPFDNPYTGQHFEREGIASHAIKGGEGDEQTPNMDTPFTDAVEAYEIALLQRGMREARFNQKKAADMLGLTYHQFRGLYRKYGEHLKES